MLMYRFITALVLIPIILFILFYSSPIVFLVLSGLVFLAAAWEWSSLMGLKLTASKILYLLFMLWCMGAVLYFNIPVRLIYTLSIGWWVVAFIFILCYPTFSGWWGRGLLVRGLMGLLVLIPCWTSLNVLRSQTNGINAILFLFVLIWGADTYAYLIGRRWGRHKLCPLVSPGKSWEGLAAALLGTVGVVLVVLWALGIPRDIWWAVVLMAVVTVCFSIIGDLFESMLKRQVGLKDSGRLLPGHGGLLDRIDSLTAAAPVFTVGGLMLAKYFY